MVYIIMRFIILNASLSLVRENNLYNILAIIIYKMLKMYWAECVDWWKNDYKLLF